MRLIFAVVAGLCASSAAGQTVTDGSDAKMPPALRSAMVSELQNRLRDADHAKIKGLKPAPHANPPLWCGLLNAPNGAGGLTGFGIFRLNPENGRILLWEENEDEFIQASTRHICGM